MSAIKSPIPKRLPWSFDEPTELIAYKNVHTVCEESRCPNRNECSSWGVATFLIGGRECTRACKFCHVATGKPIPLSHIVDREHDDIINAAKARDYKYLVITSVARDDDEAGLAAHFARITRSLNALGVTVELLIPDFHARPEHLRVVADAKPAVIAHNVETVERLSPYIRPQAKYQRSLAFFNFFREAYPHIVRKSGFMVGLGEERSEISTLLSDMKRAAVEIVTVGQYLRPTTKQAPLLKNYPMTEFLEIESEIETYGFLAWEVGPYVRSSYMAETTMAKLKAELVRRNSHIHDDTLHLK
ncbi:MAG TPA: lipoyl synthase [Turneriella sp.]|nr:lipoyl synthase [Turneriella sp.]